MVWHNLVYALSFGLRREDVQLSDLMKECVRGALEKCAEGRQWTIHELHVDNDHVVMVVQADPGTSVESMAHLLKDMSDKSMKEQFSELRDLFPDVCLWADEYAVETVGELEPESMQEYLDAVDDEDTLS